MSISLFLWYREDTGGIADMYEASVRFAALSKDLRILLPDLGHLFCADLAVSQWRSPVWCSLKDGKVSDFWRDGLNRLYRGGSSPDYANSLVSKTRCVFAPSRRMPGLAFEIMNSGDVW